MSDQMIHLAVDLLGADTPEEELCRGAVRALVGNPALFLHLCGHADVLSAVTAEIGAAEITGRYEIVDAPVALSNNEDPMQAYQRKMPPCAPPCGWLTRGQRAASSPAARPALCWSPPS